MQRPAPGGLRLLLPEEDILEPSEEQFPDVALLGRQGPAIREVLHALPGEREFQSPPLAAVGGVIQMAIHMHGGAQPRKVPIEEGPAGTARMRTPPEVIGGTVEVAGEGEGGSVEQVELRNIEPTAAPIGVAPDEEDLIEGTERVDLQYVVAVAAINKQFDIVLAKDDRIALR